MLHLEVARRAAALEVYEGAGETHTETADDIVALAVEVGDIHMHHIFERRLRGELDVAVGFCGEDDAEAAVGGGDCLTAGHLALVVEIVIEPPAAVKLAPHHTVLHTGAAHRHRAVARRKALHGAGLSETRRRACGSVECDHKLGLLVFLHADRLPKLHSAVALDKESACYAVGGDDETGIGNAEIVGRQVDGVDLLAVGVGECQLQPLAIGNLGFQAIGAINHHRHLHRVAGLVDGAVGAHLGVQAHRRVGLAVVVVIACRKAVAVALDGNLVAPPRLLVSQPVAAVAVGNGRSHHSDLIVMFFALHAHLLSRYRTAGAAVEQHALASILHQQHLGAVHRVDHEAVGLEILARRHHQQPTARRQRRQRHIALGILVLLAALHLPFATRHRLGRQQLVLGLVTPRVVLVAVLPFGVFDDAVVQPVDIAVAHPLQAGLSGDDPQAAPLHVYALLLNLVGEVGALDAAFALGCQRDGRVAVAQRRQIVAVAVAPFGGTLVEQCIIGALGAAELSNRLTDALKRHRVVGHIGEIVEQAVLVEDAYVVAVPSVEVCQHLLQLNALLNGSLVIVAQYTQHHHVVGRGCHPHTLLSVAEHLYLLHGRPLQYVG